METYRQQVDQATEYVQSHLTAQPEVALILGTGLGRVADEMQVETALDYGSIPHHPVSTVTSHHGRLLVGGWGGKQVVAMQGRFHLYEGYSPRQIAFPIRLLASLGIKTLFISNAAGGLNPNFRPTELMLISDHINCTGQNPLVGSNWDEWGPRFPDMTEPYSRRLQELALEGALQLNMRLHRGVYVGVLGPNMETAAETRLLRAAGADAVGMSTIMEVITAVHAGLQVLGVSAISNVNLPDAYQPAPIEEVIANAERAGSQLLALWQWVMARL
ncbi:MAG TPA: purine-nucleoside phosphorylase [Syntrophobacteraceae bacterium]|nr:purine-nucleoside phosphorylase [Syntrophobacteraceae bacterium]HBD10059.1 purine-nucleoside phosphorylase [Syntrophobacteraceae bacterium]HBZ54320.1 purine-nucleoside phosphorylase [Syntrophobacteraceae bacterium]